MITGRILKRWLVIFTLATAVAVPAAEAAHAGEYQRPNWGCCTSG